MEEKTTEEKRTAVYLMVRGDELQPGDSGKYDNALARQKSELLRFLEEKTGEPADGVEIYTRRGQLLIDVERERIKRLVVLEKDRLGSSREEIDGIVFEINMAGIDLLIVR